MLQLTGLAAAVLRQRRRSEMRQLLQRRPLLWPKVASAPLGTRWLTERDPDSVLGLQMCHTSGP